MINLKIFRHWQRDHEGYSGFRVQDIPTGTILPLNSLFKCLGQCPDCKVGYLGRGGGLWRKATFMDYFVRPYVCMSKCLV